MRLIVEDAVVVQERFDTHADLVDHFRDHEASHGRIPPAFMWAELLMHLAVFVAEFLGEKALDKIWERVRRKEDVKQDAAKILTELAREGMSVRIVLETKAESEIVDQLREQLPGVEILTLPM